jgi:hypothetical protein
VLGPRQRLRWGKELSIPGDQLRVFASRQWFTHLLILTIALRIFVPAGFMLDTSGASGSPLQIVICTGYGPAGGGTGHDEPGTSSPASDMPCAAATAFSILVPSETAIPASLVNERMPLSGPRHAGLLPPARAGPAHGSRAPPLHS